MIRHINGTVAHIGNDNVVVDVAGVGYLVYTTKPSAYTLDSTVKLHTYQAVRETALDLYGFHTLDELEIFELLLGLPKIGPKSAMQILTAADLELLTTAVLNDDPAHLSKMAGIGKKTAEKVVVGLKDVMEERGYGVPGGKAAGPELPNSWQTDAVDALVALGYPQSDARKAVQQLPETTTNANEAIQAALKELSQG